MIKIGYLFESHAHFPGDQLFPVGQDDRIPDFFSGRIPFHFSVQGRRFPGLGMSIIRTNSVHLCNEIKGKKVPRTQTLYKLTATQYYWHYYWLCRHLAHLCYSILYMIQPDFFIGR